MAMNTVMFKLVPNAMALKNSKKEIVITNANLAVATDGPDWKHISY
jgi:hypothetical protein